MEETLAEAVAESAGESADGVGGTFSLVCGCQWIGNSQQVARKHDLQVTDGHDERATSNVASFVASQAPQGVANEKCDAAKPAENRNVSLCVAVPVGLRGCELPPKTREISTNTSAHAVFVPTSRTPALQNNPLDTWLNACPVELDDRRQEIIRQIAQWAAQ